MIGSIFKYGSVLVVGAVTMVFGMHWSDDGIIAQAKLELEDLLASARLTASTTDSESLVLAQFDNYVFLNRPLWTSSLLLASSVKELDQVISDLRNK